MGEGEIPDQRGGPVRYRHDIDPGQPYCVAIAEAVADATGTEPGALPEVLYEVIDADAVEQLFDHADDGNERDLRLSFRFCDRLVTVFPDQTVVVTEDGWA